MIPTFLMAQAGQEITQVGQLKGQSWLKTHALCTLSHCLPGLGHMWSPAEGPGVPDGAIREKMRLHWSDLCFHAASPVPTGRRRGKSR